MAERGQIVSYRSPMSSMVPLRWAGTLGRLSGDPTGFGVLGRSRVPFGPSESLREEPQEVRKTLDIPTYELWGSATHPYPAPGPLGPGVRTA